MRKSHLDYLKTIATGITIGGIAIFPSDKFLEIDPPTDRFQESIPFCVVKYVPVTPQKVGRRVQKLQDKEISGIRNIRHLKQHFKTDYRYSLNFWLNDPEKDVISQPGGETGENDLQPSDLGVFDQVMLHIAKISRILNEQGATVEVMPGRCAVVADPAGEIGAYKIYTEVVFYDGLYEIENNPSLTDATIEIEEPTTIQQL